MFVARSVLALGSIGAASFVVLAILSRLPVPSWDDWDWLTWLLSEPLTAGRFFVPHNEHVIPIPRLLFWLQYLWQGMYGSLLFWVSLLSQLAVGAIVWRVIADRWPIDASRRWIAIGGASLALFCAWQLHSIVLSASIVFPLVLFFAVLAFSLSMTALDGRHAGLRWPIASVAASLGAMLTTTSGLAVPVIIAVLAARQRTGRALALAHALLAAVGVTAYVLLTRGGSLASPDGAASMLTRLPIVLAYFLAFFGSFITYASTIAGIVAGALLIGAGLILSWQVIANWPAAPPLERFALAVMIFSVGSALMVSVGRAEVYGLTYAAQSRYSTYAMAYWAALLLMWMSALDRGAAPRLVAAVSRAPRWLALPACLMMLMVQAVSGAIWLAKADTMRAAGLALMADVRDEEWMRTLHGMPDAVYHARALAIANGDRSLVHADLGRRVTLDAATVECSASLSMTTAPGGQALRLSGTVQVDADTGWILDREGIVVGLAERAPVVDRPDPSGAEIFSALRRAIASGELFSHSRWLGFAPAAAQRPLTFVATGAGTVRCRTSLLGNSRNHLPGVIQELDSRIARGIDR